MNRLALAFVVMTAPAVVAQPKKDPPPKPVPGVPTLTTPATLGLTQGKKAEVTLTGTNLKDVSAVAVIGAPQPITTTVAPGQTDAAKCKVTFDVPADAAIGLYQLRVVTPNGVSNFRPVCVDSVPEIMDNGDNTKPEKAQKIDWPCVVVGTVAAESADYYRFAVKAGQTINLDCHARRLGSPLDPCLILHDAKTGRELPALYADDTPGLQSDARYVHTFKADGEYLVQLRDSTYKGGADFGFRLRITTSPATTLAFPPVATADVSTPISFVSPLKSSASVKSPESTWVHTAADAWPVVVRMSAASQGVEAEPNDDTKTANAVPLRSGISARFEKKSDKDFFSFPAKKGQKIEAVCMTAEIHSPTEVHLRVLDDKGKELAVSDPQKPAARAEFTAPADGTYFVATEHLNYLFGPGEVYHLTIKPVLPEFDVVIGTDRIEIPRDGFGLLPVYGITKLNGFAGDVTLTASGLPGNVTIPATAAPTKDNPVYLPVRMKAGAKGVTPYRVAAKGGEFEKPASATDVCRAGLGGLTHLPPGWAERFVAVEVPAARVRLGYVLSSALVAGKGGKLRVEAVRPDQDEVTLAVLGLPANVTAKGKPVAKGEASAEWDLAADAKAAPGTYAIYLKGTVRTDGGERHTYAGPIPLTIASAPKVEPKKETPKK
jgi:hypothetical protein